jgi:hypothetical protein
MTELSEARRERGRLERLIDSLQRKHEAARREQERCVVAAAAAEGDLSSRDGTN